MNFAEEEVERLHKSKDQGCCEIVSLSNIRSCTCKISPTWPPKREPNKAMPNWSRKTPQDVNHIKNTVGNWWKVGIRDMVFSREERLVVQCQPWQHTYINTHRIFYKVTFSIVILLLFKMNLLIWSNTYVSFIDLINMEIP